MATLRRREVAIRGAGENREERNASHAMVSIPEPVRPQGPDGFRVGQSRESPIHRLVVWEPKLQLQKEAKPPRIDVHIPSEGMGLPPGYHITPDEPLNLAIHEGENDAPPIAPLFASQLQAWAEDNGASSIRQHIDREANLRNQLLYASDQGWPEVRRPDGVIVERKTRVFVLLALVIIILQTRSHQLLAKQAVKAYCAALGIDPREPIDLTPPDHDLDYLIEVRRSDGSEPKARLRRKIRNPFPPSDLNFSTNAHLGPTVLASDPVM